MMSIIITVAAGAVVFAGAWWTIRPMMPYRPKGGRS